MTVAGAGNVLRLRPAPSPQAPEPGRQPRQAWEAGASSPRRDGHRRAGPLLTTGWPTIDDVCIALITLPTPWAHTLKCLLKLPRHHHQSTPVGVLAPVLYLSEDEVFGDEQPVQQPTALGPLNK
ncbi:hypothetical protein FOA52_003616 [Chlamydomonas sp. UWO 241]|nr:hypothetical protein FOA52_003616 [Chlamydomonas sp. UWO 241]